jgi:hypothetical protein
VLVRKIDGNCSDWVEATDVVLCPTMVTDVEVDEELVVEEVEALEAAEEVDELGMELVAVVVVLIEVDEVLLLVPMVRVVVEEVKIPLIPITSAAARIITMIITVMIILPIAGLSPTVGRHRPVARRFDCNLVAPRETGKVMEMQKNIVNPEGSLRLRREGRTSSFRIGVNICHRIVI